VAVGLSLPPWQPVSPSVSDEQGASVLSQPMQQQTSQSGLATLDAKLVSGTVQPSFQESPQFYEAGNPYPVPTEQTQVTSTPSTNHDRMPTPTATTAP
jgi:hypothetical protein